MKRLTHIPIAISDRLGLLRISQKIPKIKPMTVIEVVASTGVHRRAAQVHNPIRFHDRDANRMTVDLADRNILQIALLSDHVGQLELGHLADHLAADPALRPALLSVREIPVLLERWFLRKGQRSTFALWARSIAMISPSLSVCSLKAGAEQIAGPAATTSDCALMI